MAQESDTKLSSFGLSLAVVHVGRGTEMSEDNSQEEEPKCKHHWVIETPKGPKSRGACKKCGEEREFVNSEIGYDSWKDLSDSVGLYQSYPKKEKGYGDW